MSAFIRKCACVQVKEVKDLNLYKQLSNSMRSRRTQGGDSAIVLFKRASTLH